MRLLGLLLPSLAALLASSPTAALPELDSGPPTSSSPFRSLATFAPTHKRLRPSDVVTSPLLLVSTIDGALHALERNTGNRVWSVEGLGGGSDFAMVGSEGSSLEYDDLAEGEDEEKFVVDPKKGEIWLGHRRWDDGADEAGDWQLRKLGVTVPDLVHASFQASPIQFTNDRSRIFIGKMESSLFGIELDTGTIVGQFGAQPTASQTAESVVPSSCGAARRGLGRGRRRRKSSGSGSSDDDAEFEAAELEAMLDEMEQGHSRQAESCPQNLLYITRTDYTLRIHSTSSTLARTTQTLRYSTYGPPDPARLDPALTSIWGQGGSSDGRFATLATRWYSGDRKLMAGVLAIKPDGERSHTWAVEMPDALPVAFFDILSLKTSGATPSAPFILPHPLPPAGIFSPPPSLKAHSRAPKVLFIGRSSSSSLFALSKDNFPALGNPDPSPGQARQMELEGYHYLIEADASDVLSHGIEDRLSIDGPSSMDPELHESLELGETDDELAWIDPPIRTSRIWLIKVFAVYLPLLLVGLTGLWHFLGSALPSPSALVFSSANHHRQQQHSPLLPPFDSKPASLSTRVTSSQPSSEDSNGNPPSYDSSKLKDLPPLPNDDDEDGLAAMEAGMGHGKKKKRRGKLRGKKKGAAKQGDEDGGEDEEDDDKKESVAVIASARETAVEIAPVPVPVKEGGLVVSEKLLGVGSHGTMVFEGTFQSRPVAVKRLLSHFTTLASHEVSLLQSTDSHPNVVRYFYEEQRDPWLYIALELCPASLADLIDRPAEFPELVKLFDPQVALKGVVQGVRHLHDLKVCHRDIKPGNILVTQTHSHTLKMLISDFGLAKRVPVDQSSYGATLATPSATTMMPSGTPGWRAPEVLMRRGGSESDLSVSQEEEAGWEVVGAEGSSGSGRGKKPTASSSRLTSAVDVFALGCVFYWVLTGGDHPFGDRYEREGNICRNRSKLDGLSLHHGEEGQEARHLIEQMIRPESSQRPSTTTILLHPYFWSPGRRLAFLQDASDSFEILERDPPDPLLVALETGSAKVIGPARDWIKLMDQGFVETLGKYRKYDVSSLRDLLRALRNKKHHFMDLPASARLAMSPLPEGFLNYFTSRFPDLFLHVYTVVAESQTMREDDTFRSYFVEDHR